MDIAITDVRPDNYDRQLLLPDLSNPVLLLVGVQKLLQRYMVLMYTKTGSQLKYPEFGTDFLLQAERGMQSLDNYMHAFNLANAEVVTDIRKEQIEYTDTPASELMDTVVLSNVELIRAESRIRFTLKLYTLAGDETEFVLPFSLA